MNRLFMGATTAGVLMAALITATPAQAARQAKSGDFNGDGKVDLVVGAPGAAIRGWQSGAVGVLNGSKLPGTAFTQDSGNIPDTAEQYERFGVTLASGDFDADGFADLAVGTPLEGFDVDGNGTDESSVGSVTVIYGSRAGLDADRSQAFTQASPDIPGDPGQAEQYGGSLAAGDFDRDGRADLAIGARNDQDGRQWAGSITVLRGGPQGLSGVNAQLIANEVQAYEFGQRLAAGDVDGNRVADLVQVIDTGVGTRVIGYPGGSAGLDPAASFSKDVPGFSLHFGSVAVGDLNGDRRADVVVGDPQYSSQDSGGQVAVLLRQGGGLADPLVINQDSPGVPDSNEQGDRFGWSLAIGDVNRDGRGELAIGAPGEDLETSNVVGAGAVTVLRGSPAGVGSRGARWFTQGADGVPDSAEAWDQFGSAVSLRDHTGDGRADLVISAEQETVGGFISAGLVIALDGVGTSNAAAFDLGQFGATDPSFGSFGHALLP